MAIPFVLVGDSPFGPTGLGRIARDVLQRLRVAATRADDPLPLDIGAVGWEAARPLVGRPSWYVGHTDSETWGAEALAAYWATRVDPRQTGIVFSIWDPARCFALKTAQIGDARWWGYMPIDGENVRGTISGPPADGLARYDRILAYTRYGRRVLTPLLRQEVEDLPHGIDLEVFQPKLDQESWELVGELLAPTVTPRSILIGAVATNQPRKDLGLLFEAVARMRREGPVKLWLHVDREIGPAWAIPQLAADFDLSRHLVVTTNLTDAQLACVYSWCAVTIAPGLGEGFGYPLVESLACGTPVVHGSYGGGTELIPCPQWVFPERARRVEGAYAIARPVYQAEDVANAAWAAIHWRQQEPGVVRAYCRASVEHLSWDRLWPAWEAWMRQGTEAMD